MTEIVSQRQLNRTLLDRQMLLARSGIKPLKAVETLLGLQAQAPLPPYIALWSRLRDFDPMTLSNLLEKKKAVRVAAMRSTVHLLSARDCFALRSLTQNVIERSTLSNHGKILKDIDLKAIGKETRRILRDGPLAAPDLGRALQLKWPEGPAQDLAMLARAAEPLIQPPPRGLWGQSGTAKLLPAEAWLGAPTVAPETYEEVVLRYLAAFGPTGVMDFQTWSGLTKANVVFEKLEPKLITYKNEAGKVLYDVKGLKLADADVEAPARFLGDYDNLTLSHADRTRVISGDTRKAIASKNGQVPGTILVDGEVAASWRLDRKKTVTLEIQPFQKLNRSAVADIKAEGQLLLDFLVPAAGHAIKVL